MIPEWVKRVCRAWPLTILGDCDTIFLPCAGTFLVIFTNLEAERERVEIDMRVLTSAGRHIEVYAGRSAVLNVVAIRKVVYTGSVVKRTWSAEESKRAAIT